MRKCILPVALLFSTFVNAQNDRFAYAVTDIQQQGSNWNYLRKVDLQTGEYSNVLFSGIDVELVAYDASSRKQLEKPVTDARYGTYINAAFATGVAAVAYDKKSNRLYFTPMLFDQLRYIDLKTMKVYYVMDKGLTGKAQKSSSQGDIVTRMAMASDGNGYALTNDGTQLIRFSTGRKVQLTDLGSLVDDPANKGVSIHNSCSSFGGDMIADDNGNLYVFSARNHVFRVNIESRVATHLGVISGLPNGFTVNGAVVGDNNEILVTSAVKTASWFTVDMRSWVATEYKAGSGGWNSSDLANSNLIVTKPKTEAAALMARTVPEIGDGKINIYPNPVTDKQFVIQFRDLTAGSYTVNVTDVTGRQVVQQVVNVNAENQNQTIRMTDAASKGIYLVKINDTNNRSVFTSKLVVQ